MDYQIDDVLLIAAHDWDGFDGWTTSEEYKPDPVVMTGFFLGTVVKDEHEFMGISMSKRTKDGERLHELWFPTSCVESIYVIRGINS